MENIHKSPIYQINPDCMVLGVLSDHLAFFFTCMFSTGLFPFVSATVNLSSANTFNLDQINVLVS